MGKDYLALVKAEPGDKVDHGVKGMKWGVRNDGPTGHKAKAVAGAVQRAMGPISGLNRSAKYKGKDLTKDTKLMAEYNKDAAEHFKTAMTRTAKAAAVAGTALALTPIFPPAIGGLVAIAGTSVFTTHTTVTSRSLEPGSIEGHGPPSNQFILDTHVTDSSALDHADGGSTGTAFRLIASRDEQGFITDLDFEEVGSIKHHGIKGMKWGIRRSPSALSGAKKVSEATPTAHVQSEPKQVVGAASGESSSDRYSRLAAEAKGGKAHLMTEQDLKFFNARTEALVKINKLNQTEPGWLSKTTKKVLLNAAEKTMQSITNEIAGKYISGPVIEGLKGKPEEAPKPKQAKEPPRLPLPKHNPIGFAPPKK